MAQVRQVDMGRWTKVETNGPGGHATVEVRPGNVRPCVSQREIRRTALRILPKLGQKLRGDELGTVARPFFP